MARPARFERATLCLEGRRSIQLSYGRSANLVHFRAFPSQTEELEIGPSYQVVMGPHCSGPRLECCGCPLRLQKMPAPRVVGGKTPDA